MKAFQHKILLASKSPRRSELLQKAGFTFAVNSLEVEETYPDSLPALEVPEYLARKKADGNRSLLTGDQIIITADTVVILDDEIFGKPKDAEDAKIMLSRLSGNTHTVVTGVCILSKSKQVSFSDLATVTLASLNQEEINYYVDTYQPFDKAGSYAIQEWIGICKIEKINGTYSNIMGLPMQKLYAALDNF